MIRSIGEPNSDIIWLGRKQGLEIYMTGATETSVIVRPGALHINNGFINRLIHSADFTTVDLSSFSTKWVFITMNDAGTIQARASTGGAAISARPSDDVYGWVDGDNTKFKHHKQGYYWAENERILGAVWVTVDPYASHIINNLSGSDEIGENSLGEWKRTGKISYIDMWGYITGNGAASNFADADNTLPVPAFSSYKRVLVSQAGFKTGSNPSTRLDTTVHVEALSFCGNIDSSNTLDVSGFMTAGGALTNGERVVWHAEIEGYWHL